MASKHHFRLSRDARGNYRRVIGRRCNETTFTEATFYLGRDAGQAAVNVMNLEKCWEAVKARWSRTRDTQLPCWDNTTYEIAKAVGLGKPSILLPYPLAESIHLLPWDAAMLGVQRWLGELREMFPFLQIDLEDAKLRTSVATALGLKTEQVKQQAKELAVLTDTPEGGRLDAALLAFRDHLAKAHVRPEGGLTSYGITAQKRVDALLEHLAKQKKDKTPLSRFNKTFIDEWELYWKARPVTKRTGKPCSVNWVRDVVKILREFIRWLHGASDWDWKKPAEYEVRRMRIPRTNEEKAKKRVVPKYTRDELAILWEYATPVERVFMILALNCGFGAGEIRTLRVDEVLEQSRRIEHVRTKTGVYGQWALWPETLAAVEWYKTKLRPPSDSPYLLLTKKGTPLALPTKGGNRNMTVQNAWSRLTERIHKDHPSFPVLSFNKLRKTASNYIRRKFGGETADLFLCHGKEEMVDAYTDAPFCRVHQAVRRLRKALESMFAQVPVPFPEDARKSNPALSRGQIKRIVELRRQGYRIKKICEEVGVSRDTVRRYLKQHPQSQAT